MKFQELDPEKKFRIRHKVVEYSYGAFGALLEIATKEKVDVIDLWKIFDGEMYTNVEYYRDTEKAPEMVATSTEAKEIISEDKSITTNPENPDPAMLIASDGMIAVGVVGPVLVGLVIAGAVYVLGDYE